MGRIAAATIAALRRLKGDLSEMAFAYSSPPDAKPHGPMAASAARRNAVLALIAVATITTGCGAGENLDGAFGAQDVGVATGSAAGVNSSATGSLVVGSGPTAVEYECPRVTVRTGAATWQVPDRAGGLRYQGSIGDLARECAIVNGTMTVKVGIEGRVLMGDKGTPGQLKVPVRIAVVHEGPNPKPITTKYFAVPLEIPQGQMQAAFTVVEDQIAFPLAKPEEIERYIIYVGYDPQGEQGGRATPTRTTRPRPAADGEPPPRTSARPPAAKPAAPKPAASSPDAAAAAPARTQEPDVFGPPPSTAPRPSAPSNTFSPAPAKQQPTDVFGPPPG